MKGFFTDATEKRQDSGGLLSLCPERRISEYREERQVELGTETRVVLQVPWILVIF